MITLISDFSFITPSACLKSHLLQFEACCADDRWNFSRSLVIPNKPIASDKNDWPHECACERKFRAEPLWTYRNSWREKTSRNHYSYCKPDRNDRLFRKPFYERQAHLEHRPHGPLAEDPFST